jgi:hypothetical protein
MDVYLVAALGVLDGEYTKEEFIGWSIFRNGSKTIRVYKGAWCFKIYKDNWPVRISAMETRDPYKLARILAVWLVGRRLRVRVAPAA